MGKLQQQRLNPCCNGIYLIMKTLTTVNFAGKGLNPCCNGIYLIIGSLLLER